MNSYPPAADMQAAAPATRPKRRLLLWASLVALLVVAQSLLVVLTIDFEANRAQDRADALATQAAAEIKREGQRIVQSLQSQLWGPNSTAPSLHEVRDLMRERRDLARIERRDVNMQIVDAIETPFGPALFEQISREAIEIETRIACGAAQRSTAPEFSRSYFVPFDRGLGQEVTDLCLPVQAAGRHEGFVVVSVLLTGLLDKGIAAAHIDSHELSFVDSDGSRLARAGAVRGAGVYRAERLVDLPGHALLLRVDAVEGSPRLIPNLAIALVMGLSVGLFAVVLMLVRDTRRRARAEKALADTLAFRKAMEDSLVTGLRARDLDGRLTYANPAFCSMVGFTLGEMREVDPPPYWPPERTEAYRSRQLERQREPGAAANRDGYETEFVRKSGERFAVMVYDAPLMDAQGRQTGWMSATVDITERRRVEELARQQQERLQASARLATVGEMASLLSHELNQPLAAISSYATGSLNLIDAQDPQAIADVRQAMARIAEQAERAGRVIKSVNDFVRRRDRSREPVSVQSLIDAVMPLVRLQARKSNTAVLLDLAEPQAQVLADRTLVEQVLLNLSRNGIQAMDLEPATERRILRLCSRVVQRRWVAFSVIDAGPGIAPEVSRQLFTPFFTTRLDGMGLGLSLCRTVVEQHGGALDFESRPQQADGAGGGTEFRFTLPLSTPDGPEPHTT